MTLAVISGFTWASASRMLTRTSTIAFARSADGKICRSRPRYVCPWYACSVTSAGIPGVSLATLFSLTSVCTSSSPRSAIVAMAPPSRDACPWTPKGDTVSPISARFLMTTPSNGARTFVFSSASSATRTRARADAIAASADFTRAAETAAAASAAVRFAFVVMPSLASARWRSRLRTSSSRAAMVCASIASASATARRAASSCASMSACSISAMTAPRRTRVPSSNLSVAMRPPTLTPTSLLRRATT